MTEQNVSGISNVYHLTDFVELSSKIGGVTPILVEITKQLSEININLTMAVLALEAVAYKSSNS